MSEAEYLVFDVESTGVDVFNDRIVQLVISLCGEDGSVLSTHEWIINPGVAVPQGAAEVHGFTTEFLQEHGQAPHKALWEADLVFKQGVNDGLTFVAYNANFDLSIITAEMARHSLGSRYGFWIADNVSILDPLVVDRHRDKYRKGKRTLQAVAGHYGVPFDEAAAHKADYDVEVTAKVAARVRKKYGQPTNQQQAAWYASWARGLEAYLKRSDPEAKVSGDWPVRLEG